MARPIAASMAVAVAVLAACAGGSPSPSPAVAATAAATPVPTLETSVTDVDVGGRTLHLVCIGPAGADRPTIIFESGLGGDNRTWRGVLGRLGTTDRGCAYDRAGIGASEPATTPRTTEDQVADLEKLLDGAGINGPIVLVGSSLGGWNAMVYADHHPDDVAGLVLVDVRPPTASARWLAELPPEVPGESEALQGNRGEFTTFEMDPTLNPEGLDLRASSAQAAAAMFGARPIRFLWAKDTSGFWEGLEPDLASRLDGVLTQLRSEMEAKAGDASEAMLVESAHDIPEEAPEDVVDAIRSVLDALP